MNFFLTKIHFFAISKMAKYHFFVQGTSKTAKNAISRKKNFIYLISRVFLPGLFFNFLAPVRIHAIFIALFLHFYPTQSEITHHKFNS